LAANHVPDVGPPKSTSKNWTSPHLSTRRRTVAQRGTAILELCARRMRC
jgi:hypothetical protein